MKLAVKLLQDIVLGILFITFLYMLFFSFSRDKTKAEVPNIFGYKLMTVLTGSMEPSIKAGDMIIEKNIKPKSVQIGDILTYKNEGDVYITHRVTGIEHNNDQLLFRTKGDANNIEDNKLIEESSTVGKVVLRIPYGGYVARFITGKLGFVIFFLIPIIMLLVDKIKTISRELIKGNSIN